MAAKKKQRAPRKAKGLPPILSPGRPSKYQPIFSEHAAEMCRHGATDKEVADYLGIGDTTLYRWRWAYPEFREALRLGKEAADDRVEMSLYRRATGYSFDSEQIVSSSHQGTITVERVAITEHVPPDPGSMKLWLVNRRPKVWREKLDVEQSGSIVVIRRDPTIRPENYGRKTPVES